MAHVFEKATRKKVKLKILIEGPSGSGKTIGALHTARGLVGPTGKVALIDSEKDRSEYYADRYDFDKLSLTDLRCQAYGQALQAAIEAGYEAVVIDSLSHAWLDVLTRKDAYDAANPSSNRFTNWQKFSPEWERLIRFILECPAHVICTARSKQSHEQVEENGKKKVIKLGLAPQIREGTEYEFAVTFSLNNTHSGEATKDNTNLFGDTTEPINLLGDKVTRKLNEWLSSGNAVQIQPKPVTPPVVNTPEQVKNIVANSSPGRINGADSTPAPALTLEGIKAKYDEAKAKVKTSEKLGEWVAWVEGQYAKLTGTPTTDIDLVESIRQELVISDLAEGKAVWQNWTPEMLDKGKHAVSYWLDNAKA